MQSINWKITLLSCSFIVASCSSSDNTDTPSALVPPQVVTDEPFSGLRVIGDRDKFESAIKDALRNSLSGQGGEVLELAVDGDTAASPAPLPSAEPVSAPIDPAAPTAPVTQTDAGLDAAPESTAAAADLNVTETNVQEIGVDEADRIKSDGEYLYVLNQNAGDFPVPLPAVEEGVELANRLSLVYEPNGKARIRVLSLDKDTPDAQELTQIEIETKQQRADGLYLHKSDTGDALIMTSSSMGGYWGYWDASYQFLGQKSSVYKIDINNPAAAAVSDSLSLDGQIVASRRIGNYLYVASRFFPYPEPYPVDTEQALLQIEQTPVEDLLPKITRQSDGAVQALADANNCFVAAKAKDAYYAPDIVTLAVIDLNSVSVTDSVCYLGASETLYASPNAIYLATTEWNHGFDGPIVGEPVPLTEPVASPSEGTLVDPDAPPPVDAESVDEPAVDVETSVPEHFPVTTTAIHQFNIDGNQLGYVGSGSVEGHLGWNYARMPYRMGEKDGYLRIVTHNDFNFDNSSPVTLSILRPDGNGRLDVVSRLPNDRRPQHIGKPDEDLYATRFLGEKAYLVTFLQTDPLYVIDLSNPNDPYIAGELEIPGFSDYLRPIGANHLLGIGRGAESFNGSPQFQPGAFTTGLKLSLFDVADPTSPKEVQSLEIGKNGTQSNALYNPHAVTVQLGDDQRPTRLAISIDLHDIPTPYSGQPGGWYDWRESGLFGYEIKTDVNAGIAEHGRMIVESRGTNLYPEYYYGTADERSVIVNDGVFYIRGEKVYAGNWNSLGNFNGPR